MSTQFLLAGTNPTNPAERKETMKQENRVLGRVGARELNTNEIERVQGAIVHHTLTACALRTNGQQLFGDTGFSECSADNS
jgi:hypothetical protein